MSEFEKIGGGKYDVFRKKPKKKFDWGALLGWLVFGFLVVVITAGASG